eukprot:gene10016-20849_t
MSMDFFGFGGNADLSSPIGTLIRSATDPLLLGPDWAKNIEICDTINSSRDMSELAVKAILRRLQDSDQKVVSLSLTISEACMKNCGHVFASFISRSFMDEMISIAKGSKGVNNQDDALRLIQQWGKMYQSQRGQLSFFYDNYNSLRSKGFHFPVEETDTPHNNAQTSGGSHSHEVRPAAKSSDDVQTLQNDLNDVFDKVRLCREMLPESPGIESDEALSEVIGYLEACRDRLVDLVEAGAQGLLGEDLLALCLRANDAVLRTLEAEKNGTPIEIEDGLPAPVPTTATSESNGKAPSATASASARTPNTMHTGLVDDFDNDEFAGLTLKTSGRRAGQVSKAKAIAPPHGLVIPPIPAPGSKAATSVNLLPLEDLLTGDVAVAAPVVTRTTAPSNDIDIFLNTADSMPHTVPMSATPAVAATEAIPGSMSDADFDSFLNSITTTK